MIEEHKKVIELSGVELLARDQIGNTFDLDSNDAAWMIDIVSRQDLSLRERAMMLYGLINGPSISPSDDTNKEDGI